MCVSKSELNRHVSKRINVECVCKTNGEIWPFAYRVEVKKKLKRQEVSNIAVGRRKNGYLEILIFPKLMRWVNM